MNKNLEFFKKLNNILPRKIKYSLFFLYFALIISALLETIGLGTIPIFISILIDPQGNKDFFGIDLDFFLNL